MRKASRKFEAEMPKAAKGKTKDTEEESSLPVILSPDFRPVQSALGSAEEESDSTATNGHA